MPDMALRRVLWLQRARTIALCVLAVVVVASIGVLLGAKPAHAATFRVNSMEDAGDMSPTDGECASEPFRPGFEPKCTLRAAIQETNGNGQSDTIIFDPVLSGTITLTLGQLEVADDAIANELSIEGPGARKITVSANDASRVFLINQDTDVTIGGLTITDGNAHPMVPGMSGGGIYTEGTLKLTNSTVSGNTATEFGGGIRNTGGTLELINTTVSGNSVANNAGGGSGAGILNDGGGILRLTNTTVSGNTAANNAGGIYNILGATVELANTTVSSNTAANNAGGIYNDTGGTLRLANTVVARNTATTNPDTRGTFNSQGNNLIGNTTGATGFVASDLKNVNPLLGPLRNNGGLTNTHALLPGSPAVDAGSNATCPFADQRGVLRKDGDENGTVICDIGAFERNDLIPPRVTATTPIAGQTGVARNANLTATFSEKMDRTTLTKATFKLFKVNADGSTTQITNVVVGSSTDGLTATLDPFGTSSTLLAANTRYRAFVTTGAKDRAGNRLDQNPSASGSQAMGWTFTTGSI